MRRTRWTALVGLLLTAATPPAAAAPSPVPAPPAAELPATRAAAAPVASEPETTSTEPGTTSTEPAPAETAPAEPAPTEAEDDGGVVPAAPTRAVSYAARLVLPVVARRAPSGRSKAVTRLRPYGSWNGGPVVLQIAEVRVARGERWVRVRLPVRPNGSTGWLRAADVEVRRLRYRIVVSRRLHKLTLLRDGRRVTSTRVVIGATGTPTPAGSFAVLEVVRQPKGEVIGPWALHLTAHSDVLDDYGGGPGRVALHGRSGPLLDDALGSSRSHGCVRMPNDVVSRLARVAVEGTPVEIR